MSKNCTNDGCSCTPNNAIKCNVTSCAHHCQDVNNCGLSSIQVGTSLFFVYPPGVFIRYTQAGYLSSSLPGFSGNDAQKGRRVPDRGTHGGG